MIGIQASLVPLLQLLNGTARDILHGWLGCTRSIGSRATIRIIQKHALYMAFHQRFTHATNPLCLPTLRWRLVGKVALFICRLHVRPELMCWKPRNVPVSFSVPQMKNVGMTIELDPKADKITCPAFGLYSSPAEYSTVGHTVLDLTRLAYQPKTRERTPHSRRHVTFCTDREEIRVSSPLTRTW